MKRLPSVHSMVKDIEFEILLGTIPQRDLRNALLAVRAQHSKFRSGVIENLRDVRLREAFNKVFQAQEMLLVLLQEMSVIIGSLQAELPQIASLMEHPRAIDSAIGLPSIEKASSEEFSLQSPIDPAELTKLMEPVSLRLDLEVRPTKLPVIGKLIQSIKIALHHLVLFYVNRLGARQAQVNKVHSEQILELYQLVMDQQEQIKAMAASINDLRARTQSYLEET